MNVGLGPTRAGIVGQDCFSETRRLGEADASRDDRLEDLAFEELAQIGLDLAGEVGAVVIHREENALDGEGGIKGFFEAIDGVHQLRDSFQRKEFALDRDQDTIGGGQGINGQEIEGGGAIDDDVVVVVPNGFQSGPEACFAMIDVDQIQVGRDQVLIGRQERESVVGRGNDSFGDAGLGEKDIVEGVAAGDFLDSDAGGGVSLGVGINQEDAEFRGGQGCREIDCRGGLTDSAFLIRDRDDSGQGGWGS